MGNNVGTSLENGAEDIVKMSDSKPEESSDYVDAREDIMEMSSDCNPEESSDYDNAEQRDTTVLKILPMREAARKAVLKMATRNPSEGEPHANFEFKRRRPNVPSRKRKGRRDYCHACRHANRLKVAECSKCDLNFCQRCLLVRHGEDVSQVSRPEVKWVCPKCRTGCGAGCEKNCCTCSRCWKLKGTQSRGISDGLRLIEIARCKGFCLHDYLIHIETHESKQEIIKRKSLWEWAKVSSKCTAEQASRHNEVESLDFTPPLSDIGHNDRMRPETTRNKCEMASGEKEMDHEEKVGSEDDRLAAIVNLQVDIYLMTLWFGKVKEVNGNTMSITLSDEEVKQKTAIRERSPARGAAHIFNSVFKNQPQDCKVSMVEGLERTLSRYLDDCHTYVKILCEELKSEHCSPKYPWERKEKLYHLSRRSRQISHVIRGFDRK